MRTGIRFQLTSISILVILFTAVVLTVTSTLILRRTLASQLAERTAQLSAVVEGEIALRRRDLEHSVDLWTHNGDMISQVNYEAWPETTKLLDQIRTARHVDIALAFDSQGKLQATSGIELASAAPFGAAHARAGLLHDSPPQSLIEPIAGHLYLIAAEKIKYFGNERGEIVLAQAFTDARALEIQKKVGSQVIAFTEEGPKASSVKLSPAFTAALQKSWKDLAARKVGDDKVLKLGSLLAADVSHIVMAFTLASAVEHVKADGPPLVAFACAVPETEMALTQRRTLIGSLGLLVVITFIGLLLGLALTNTIARPITAMAEQFSRISASGDLSLRVRDDQTNEIGDMARSFNSMQERVELLHGRVAQAGERMRKELQMASTAQEMLFQQEMPHNSACDVAAYTSTLVETSGDWYAVFDDPEAKRTIFVIADATGHGASAALLTAITHGFFQTMWTARQGTDSALARIAPSQILTMLNSVVLNSAHGTITATVFVGVLHHGSRKMVYASAGHIPPIVTRWANNEMKANILTCNPSSSIGSADKPMYEDYTVELPQDALVIIYTDGLSEIENPQGLQWGVRKLISVLRGCQADTVESVRQKLLDSVMKFASGKELMDDVTFLTVRVL